MRILRTVGSIALLLTTSVHAQQPSPTAADAWIVAPAAGSTTATAYLVVNNPTMYDVYVVSATSPAAAKVELREGTGAAEKVVSSITVSSYGAAELKAGEAHLVLVDLKQPLKSGDTVDLVLMTDGGVKMTVSAVVKAP